MTKKKKENYDEMMKRVGKQRDEIKERLKRKDYLITVRNSGAEMFQSYKKMFPELYSVPCSLEEIPKYIEHMKTVFWTHPDLKKGSKVKAKDIPTEDKRWGITADIRIEPLDEKLEKEYVSASKDGFFEIERHLKELGVK
jgi:hypothetical protein